MLSMRRSLVLSFAQKYTNLLFTLPTIMIVSRLLKPAEIGIYSVAAAFVALVHMLRDFGVSDYLIQAEKLDNRLARSAFTINLMIAWSLAAAVFLASDALAAFYSQPPLALVLKILSLNFLLLPFGSVVNALLTRDMQFGRLYKIRLVQTATQSGVTLSLAFLGFSYFSLAWGSVISMAAVVAACTFWGAGYRVPGLGLHHWRDVTGFGVQRTTVDVVSRIGVSAPDFIIGRVIDFAAVGLYSRGNGLINMFRQNVLKAISSVTYPSYAKRHRASEQPEVLLLKSISFITAFTWPFLGFSALMAFPIMRIMFGDQWDAAVPILQLLAIAAMVQVVSSELPQYFTATGRIGLVTRTTLLVQGFRIIALIAAAFYGLVAVAAAQVTVSVLSVFCFHFFLIRYTSLTVPDLFAALRKSALITAMALTPVAMVVVANPPGDDNLWIPLLTGGALWLSAWLAGLRLTRHPLWDELASWWPQIRSRLRGRPAQ